MQPDPADPYLEVPHPADHDYCALAEVVNIKPSLLDRFDNVVRPDQTVQVGNAEIVVDSGQFFDKSGLLHASLRTAVQTVGPVATGIGRTLWHYRDGVWITGGDDEIRRRCRSLLGQKWRRSHVEGIVTDLASDEAFITDAQPTEWVNTTSGLLDWRTGHLRPHTPDVASTYQLACRWDPHAECPTVDSWLAQVAPADAIPLIWEVIGTAIYGDQPFHRAIMVFGPGRNGKSTLLRLIAALIGKAHIASVTLQSLGESRFASAELFGKVANIAGDLDARSIGRTDVFKQAVGADLITAERKHGQPFTFTNRATMIFAANELPGSADLTEGFFSKWVVVPFTGMQLAPGDEDSTIEGRMHLELEGVLVKAVEGLRRAMDRGSYDRPASVAEATKDYQVSADPLRRFIDDELDVTANATDTLPHSAVYHRYKKWCDDNGARPLGANKFWTRLATSTSNSIVPNATVQRGDRYCSGANFHAGSDL